VPQWEEGYMPDIGRPATATALSLHMLGAAGTVTGSRFLLKPAGSDGMLIDYGLFQGNRELTDRNRLPPDAEVLAAQALVLTHAHMDHAGATPVLVKAGWQGAFFASPATAALCGLLLPDSGRIQEEEAQHDHHGPNRSPLPPLYTEADAIATARRMQGQPYAAPFSPLPGLQVTLHRAGHIPGSSTVLIETPGGQRVLFSGDLGRYDAPILPDPDPPPAADHVLVESTYGDRDHPAGGAEQLLGDALQQALRNGGPILIPAFAVGRTQELLYVIRKLEDGGVVPSLPVYVDSPLANGVTAVLAQHPEEFDQEMAQRIRAGSEPLRPHQLHIVATVDESKALNSLQGPAIIIAGSGMATGGRILHHLVAHLQDPRATVIFAGYQGEGTLGRQLLEGAQQVRIYGAAVQTRAKILDVLGLSAHADRNDIVRWLRLAPRPPKRVYLIHGEPAAAASLAEKIGRELGWPVSVPALGDRLDLN